VPTEEEIAVVEREIPGVRIEVVPEEGQRLRQLSQQDSYSYEIAHIFTAGADDDELRDKYDRAIAALGLHGTTPGRPAAGATVSGADARQNQRP
jgi:hypothetical protein